MLATEGLGEFERQQLKNKATLNELKKTIAIQSGQGEPRNLEDRLVKRILLHRCEIIKRRKY